MRRRAVLVALLLALPAPAAAQTCPAHLHETMAGWVPPPVCAGQGRFNDVSMSEVQRTRDMYQHTGYMDKVLACWRQSLGTQAACLENAEASYASRWENLQRKWPGYPSCLDPSADVIVMRAFLENVVSPVIFCAPGNTYAQKKVSTALSNLLHHVCGRVPLERAIDEIKYDGFLAAMTSAMDNYAAEVATMGTAGPACLTLGAALTLGDTTRAWCDSNSHRPFCATELAPAAARMRR